MAGLLVGELVPPRGQIRCGVHQHDRRGALAFMGTVGLLYATMIDGDVLLVFGSAGFTGTCPPCCLRWLAIASRVVE